MRWQLSLARQILLLQLGIVLLAVLAVAAVSVAQSDAAFRRDEGKKLLLHAESLATNDTVRHGMAGTVWYGPLAAAAEMTRGTSGANFVMVADTHGIVVTGQLRGRPAQLADSEALEGKSWTGVIEDGTKALVAHAPVLEAGTGKFLGIVIVGKEYPSLPELLGNAAPDLVTYLLLGSALGVTGSWLLARRIKRQTLGLEPVEIAGLVEHREAMLHGIKEGLISLDATGRVTLANDEALRLLNLPRDAAGKAVTALGLGPELSALLTQGSGEPDHVVVHDSRVLVLNRMPVVVRGRTVGSVTTLRDQTELTSLERELDVSRTTTDTLRAQAHEFTNRLHTIAGLMQLGQYDEAVSFIVQAGETHEALSHDVQSRIGDPSLAALVIAKASVAAEQRVELIVDPASRLAGQAGEHLSADLVTVTGNLVDNAIDAAGPGGWVKVLISQDDDAVTVEVTDSGHGVDETLAGHVFRSGFTTKDADGHRGIGLALVSRICAARGGQAHVSGSVFTARIPLPRKAKP